MSNFPEWLKRKTPPLGESLKTNQLLEKHSAHTVCRSARCPNLMECFGKGTATFLILGDTCTRSCRFCAIEGGAPKPVDHAEPERIAEISRRLGLKHVVVTSVTRDDLHDGGSRHFAQTIRTLRKDQPEAKVEVLTPDFKGNEESLKEVLNAKPHVFNHNLETVPRLYPLVRPGADYYRSLNLLGMAKKISPDIIVKSGLMLGLGETEEEVINVLSDLKAIGCDMVTIGQYLKPSKDERCLDVVRFVHPDEFKRYEKTGYDIGFKAIASGPFVRSSYGAGELFASQL
jgi:lipoic acid synthetase